MHSQTRNKELYPQPKSYFNKNALNALDIHPHPILHPRPHTLITLKPLLLHTLLQHLPRHRMHIHHRIRPPRRILRQLPRIHHNRRTHHLLRKTRQFGRHNQYIGLHRHLPLFCPSQIQRSTLGRGKERIVAALLYQMLRDAGESRSRGQVGVAFVRGNVKEDVGGGDADRDVVDAEGAGVGHAVDALGPAFLWGLFASCEFNVVEAEVVEFSFDGLRDLDARWSID
mmetsp:Transcript_38545/g.69484  ORF Transcript_38545/g.69484 Transcript_38545/m.69484 type:complete len:227 (+) Transcript_38545:121-801(+)